MNELDIIGTRLAVLITMNMSERHITVNEIQERGENSFSGEYSPQTWRNAIRDLSLTGYITENRVEGSQAKHYSLSAKGIKFLKSIREVV